MDSKQAIHMLLNKSNGVALEYKEAARLCGLSNETLQWIDKFWNHIHHEKKFYISREFVRDWLGYGEGKNMMNDFYNRNLYNTLILDKDYWKVDLKNDVVQLYAKEYMSRQINKPKSKNSKPKRKAHNRLYYICTADGMKKLMMASTNAMAKQVRNYFIEIERFSHIMFDYLKVFTNVVKNVLTDSQCSDIERKLEELTLQCKQRDDEIALIRKQRDEEIKEKDKQLLKYKNNIVGFEYIKEFISDYKNDMKAEASRESLYIMTSETYLKKCLYKIGIAAKSVKSRITASKTFNVGENEMEVICEYKVINAKKVKSMIHAALERDAPYLKFREFFFGNFIQIKEIVEHFVDAERRGNDLNKIRLNDFYTKIEKGTFDPVEEVKGIEISRFNNKNQLELKSNVPSIEYKENSSVETVAEAAEVKADEAEAEAEVKADEAEADEAEAESEVEEEDEDDEEAKAIEAKAVEAKAKEAKVQRIRSKLIAAINAYCINDKIKYDFDKDKTRKVITIVWKDFTPHLIKVLGIYKSNFRATEWKEYMKDICRYTAINLRLVVRNK